MTVYAVLEGRNEERRRRVARDHSPVRWDVEQGYEHIRMHHRVLTLTGAISATYGMPRSNCVPSSAEVALQEQRGVKSSIASNTDSPIEGAASLAPITKRFPAEQSSETGQCRPRSSNSDSEGDLHLFEIANAPSQARCLGTYTSGLPHQRSRHLREPDLRTKDK